MIQDVPSRKTTEQIKARGAGAGGAEASLGGPDSASVIHPDYRDRVELALRRRCESLAAHDVGGPGDIVELGREVARHDQQSDDADARRGHVRVAGAALWGNQKATGWLSFDGDGPRELCVTSEVVGGERISYEMRQGEHGQVRYSASVEGRELADGRKICSATARYLGNDLRPDSPSPGRLRHLQATLGQESGPMVDYQFSDSGLGVEYEVRFDQDAWPAKGDEAERVARDKAEDLIREFGRVGQAFRAAQGMPGDVATSPNFVVFDDFVEVPGLGRALGTLSFDQGGIVKFRITATGGCYDYKRDFDFGATERYNFRPAGQPGFHQNVNIFKVEKRIKYEEAAWQDAEEGS